MIESNLWKHLKPEFKRIGKFQKISDRFTPGIPDVIGVTLGCPLAIELKEFDGVRVLRLEFRPGQLDWLRDWEDGGGSSFIFATLKSTVMVFLWTSGEELEAGVSPDRMNELSVLTLTNVRGTKWRLFTAHFVSYLKLLRKP
jgi:hypothetical protein